MQRVEWSFTVWFGNRSHKVGLWGVGERIEGGECGGGCCDESAWEFRREWGAVLGVGWTIDQGRGRFAGWGFRFRQLWLFSVGHASGRCGAVKYVGGGGGECVGGGDS